jgi:hypothetical protein
MTTIKSYTDLQQSKKLAEILPLESADMYYPCEGVSPKFGVALSISDNIPCWSLASLLSVLDFPSLTQNKEDEWEVCVFDHDNDGYIEKTANNPVDACYELILRGDKVDRNLYLNKKQ